MLMLDDGQKLYLEAKARYALIKIKEQEGQKESWQLAPVIVALHEVCEMGYSIAMREVRSTPWEYVNHAILTDAAKNDSIMNHMASEGWELFTVASGWHIWRRRKLVAKIAADSKEV